MSFRSVMFGAVLAGCTALALSSAAMADGKVVITGWGGTWNDAYREGIWKPFTATSGVEVVEDQYNGELAKIRSQVESGTITWDMVSVEGAELLIGCQEGLYEKLDFAALGGKEQFISYGVHDCGLSSDIWATGLAYDAAVLKDPPKSWADFWDVKKYPGKRGMRSTAKETLEQALMADGVPIDKVYETLRAPGGVERAFKKLDELKPHIVWWESGAQFLELLSSGEVVMTSAFTGETITTAQQNKRDLKIAWDAGFLLGVDHWVILKNAPNKENAAKFLAYYAKPEVEAEFSKRMPYGTPHPASYALLSEEIKSAMPSAPDKKQWALEFDYPFWVENLDDLTAKFQAWAAK
jgi:putative spermidine/putrescine transport system substrate-binding protein